MVKTLEISVTEKMQQFYRRVKRIDDLEHRALIQLDYLLGARVGELVLIQKHNVKFSELDMTVVRPIFKVKGRPLEPTAIPVEDSFIQDIKKFTKSIKQPEHYLFPYRKYCFSYLYLEDYTRPMSVRQARRIVRLYLDTWPHYLRHMRLTHIASDGSMRSTFELMAFSHHRSDKSLRGYLHLMPAIYKGRIPVA